jgi:CRP-like cAMP-binding protein
VLEFVQYLSLVVGQLVACNRLHEVEARLARWMLMVSDRIGSSNVQLTQEFLAEMIGAGRSTVTLSAGALQRISAIEYSRGNIKIVNRELLEQSACECYPMTRRLLNAIYQG